jgi:hypothetical protein
MTGLLLALATVDGAAADLSLRSELERIARLRVFFAHQSVGANLLDGLQTLSEREGLPVQLHHMLVPENGDPLKKLRSFEQAMEARAGLDVALLKFCYVDIKADTDARALFAQYRATMERLRAMHPGTTFVHVTLPLTDVQGGIKALAKRALGRHPYGTIENLRREEYNALLRAEYRGREPIFDLARVESTAPDGSAVRMTWRGSAAPAMAPEYTDDGGHLNGAGKLRAARELVSVLAAAAAQGRAVSTPASTTASTPMVRTGAAASPL